MQIALGEVHKKALISLSVVELHTVKNESGAMEDYRINNEAWF